MKKLIVILCSVFIIISMSSSNLYAYADTQKVTEDCPIISEDIINRAEKVIDCGNGVMCAVVKEDTNEFKFKQPKNYFSRVSSVSALSTTSSEKQYTSATYSNYYWHTDTKKNFATYTFKAYFSYDGNLVNCYNIEETHYITEDNCEYYIDYTEKGKCSVSPTLACGYINFSTYYESNDKPYFAIYIELYCNQKGQTYSSITY